MSPVSMRTFEWQEILSNLPAGKKRIVARQYKKLLPGGVRLVSVNGCRISDDTMISIGDDILLECDDVEDQDLIRQVKQKSLL